MARMHPDYSVTISCPDRSIYIVAPMPETFTFDTAAQYDASFAVTGMLATTARLMGIKPIHQIMTMQFWQGNSDIELGLNLVLQAEENAEEEVMRPFLDLNSLLAPKVGEGGFLEAPAAQIGDSLLKAVSDLYKKATPGASTGPEAGVMTNSATQHTATATGAAPESTPTNPSQRFGTIEWAKQYVTNQVSIRIGRYAYFDCVVLTNVVQDLTTQPDPNGVPMHSTVNLRFKPLFTMSSADIDRAFFRDTLDNNSTVERITIM